MSDTDLREDREDGDGSATMDEGDVADRVENSAAAGRQTQRNPAVHWLLISGNRMRMVAGLSVVAGLLYFALGYLGVIGVVTASLIASAFTSAITGVFTIVAVTISINQLVLSRVIGSPGHIRERMDSVHDFRQHVEDMDAEHLGKMDEEEVVSPTMPASFLTLLLGVLRERAQALDEAFESGHDPRLQEEVRDLRATLENICDQVEDDLPRSDLSLFRVLLPILTNSFSEHLNTTREIAAKADDLTEAESAAFEDVIEALEEVNLTRHYFKTLYIHEELATVSRQILLTGLPAVLVSMGIILLYSADTIFLQELYLLGVVSIGFALVLLPLNVLFAYGLRVSTIAKMTTTFGTFTPVDEMP